MKIHSIVACAAIISGLMTNTVAAQVDAFPKLVGVAGSVAAHNALDCRAKHGKVVIQPNGKKACIVSVAKPITTMAAPEPADAPTAAPVGREPTN